MAQNPVRWFEIYVQDMNRARKFYENVFDVRLERLNTPDVEIWSFSMQIEVIERDPYHGVEYESRRAYVFAIKPGMLKSP